MGQQDPFALAIWLASSTVPSAPYQRPDGSAGRISSKIEANLKGAEMGTHQVGPQPCWLYKILHPSVLPQ